jgi:hypothetical protein
MTTDSPPPSSTTPPPPPQEEETEIVLRVPKSRKGAYVRASRAENTTLANWMFKQCDNAAGYKPRQ